MTVKQKRIALYAIFVATMIAMAFSHVRSAKKLEKNLIKKAELVREGDKMIVNKRGNYEKLMSEYRSKTTMIVFLGTIVLTSVVFSIYQLPKEDESKSEMDT